MLGEKRKRIGGILPWLALAAAFALAVGFYALYGSHNLDSDISSEMVSAQVLNEAGSWTTLTDRWRYSTELRLISPVPLYQLGLRLFASWHAARTFAVAVQLLLSALAALFMAKETGFGDGAPWLAVMVVLPYSFSKAYILEYGGFYAMHLVYAFLLFGLVARCARRGLRRSGAELAAVALLSLVSGLAGVRMGMMAIAPMALASFILGFLQLKNAEGLAEGAHTPGVRMALVSIESLLATAAGFAYHTLVLKKKYSFISYDGMELNRFEPSEYLVQIRGVLGEMGLREKAPLFSLQGLSFLLVIAFFVLTLVAAARLLRRWREIGEERRFFTLTCLIGLFMGMTLVLALRQYISRYYMVAIVMLTALPLLAWAAEPCRSAALRTAAYLALAGVFFFQTGVSFLYDYTQGKVNYEMAADWLVGRGYTQGFAGFWNANVLTEASDGRLDVWALKAWDYDWQSLELSDILQASEHFERDPEGKIFVLADEADRLNASPIFDEEHFVDFIAWSYYVYEYDSVDELRAKIAAAREG